MDETRTVETARRKVPAWSKLLLAAILVASGVKTLEHYRTILSLVAEKRALPPRCRSKKYGGSRFLLALTVGVLQGADTSHATNSTEDFA